MRSTRLPGKVLLPVLGKPLLIHQIERLRRCQLSGDLIIATTDAPEDDVIVDAVRAVDARVFRGSETDVLSRYRRAAERFRADSAVRITSDCPMIDPNVIDRAIAIFNQGGSDYVSNTLNRTFPRGLDVEVFTFSTLQAADQEAKEDADREHVTRFITRRPERFRLSNFETAPDASAHRWTVDTPEDFELVSRMMNELIARSPGYSLADALRLINERPEWSALNAQVEQKQT